MRLARIERGWSQRHLALVAGVPSSTVGRIEAGLRQPSLVMLSRLLAAADLELRVRIEPYEDHDDVLDTTRARLSESERVEQDAEDARTTEAVRAAVPARAGARLNAADA